MDSLFVSLGKLFFKYRNALFPLVYLLLLLMTRPGAFLGNSEVDEWVSSIAVVIVLAGELFRMIVIGYAYIRRGGRQGKVYASSLVQGGLYAHVRNPMYVGNYLILLGLVVLYGSLWGYLVVLPLFTLIYYSIVRNEETYLHATFGREFEDYKAHVNRFVPNLRGLRKSLSAYEFQGERVISKEYGTIFSVLLGILVILIWKARTIWSLEAGHPFVVFLWLMMVPLLVFYGVSRWMKMSGRLQSGPVEQ